MSDIQVVVSVITLTDNKLVLKSKDGVTPIFKNELSAAAFKQYLESAEGERYTVEILSDTCIMLSNDDLGHYESLSQMYSRMPESVRMPHEQAIKDGLITYEEMFLYWNMHEIDCRVTYSHS